mmetsp:Transcript_3495/g.5071  ORF Transcript_3495/g.5071 Transcript_3495/m.5071 type:complete len:115 (+) Transcript_3495:358-702(+)
MARIVRTGRAAGRSMGLMVFAAATSAVCAASAAAAPPLVTHAPLLARLGGQPLRLRGGSAAAPTLVNNFEEVGSAFVQHYYQVFDSNRAGLQSLYQDVSMLTFEGEKIMGAPAT